MKTNSEPEKIQKPPAQSAIDRIADMDTRLKILIFFFLTTILPAGCNLYLLDRFPSGVILPQAGIYLVVLIVFQFPVCQLLTHLVAQRNLTKINSYCQKVKEGVYHIPFDLPPEKGEENDFVRVRRNLYWMGQLIASREQKLVAALDALNTAQTQVMESIAYASRIQQTLLPSSQQLQGIFRDHFIWWEPRDVVGGDTYWVLEAPDGYLVAVVDCTGHGVPGAFMTLIVYTLAETSFDRDCCGDPALLLTQIDCRLRAFLHRNTGQNPVNDGCDAAICFISRQQDRLLFAGAGLSLYVAGTSPICEIRGNRNGIADIRSSASTGFTNHVVDMNGVSTVYLATDGVMDQIGGPKHLPFGRVRFKRLLDQVHDRPCQEQMEALISGWRAYVGDEPKRDDLTVLGFTPGLP